jgi:pyruvate formate lyase activating enzyme
VPPSSDLRVGGLSRLSSVDWPGQLVATVFAQGCMWDCVYCHNPHLIPAAGQDEWPWRVILEFLESRRGLLDGVVFSGGEPLAQATLTSALEQTRALGFRTALHTGGAIPARFSQVLPLLDWVGFDVKAPLRDYERITRVAGSGERAREGLRLLVESGLAHEVRTTVHPALLGEEALLELAEELAEVGAERWVLQAFRAEGARPEAATAAASPLTPELLERLRERVSAVELRG